MGIKRAQNHNSKIHFKWTKRVQYIRPASRTSIMVTNDSFKKGDKIMLLTD